MTVATQGVCVSLSTQKGNTKRLLKQDTEPKEENGKVASPCVFWVTQDDVWRDNCRSTQEMAATCD